MIENKLIELLSAEFPHSGEAQELVGRLLRPVVDYVRGLESNIDRRKIESAKEGAAIKTQAQEIDELKGSVEIGEALSIETGANLLALLAKAKTQDQEIEAHKRALEVFERFTDEKVDEAIDQAQEIERLQNAICIYVREESPSYASSLYEWGSGPTDKEAINLFVKHNQE